MIKVAQQFKNFLLAGLVLLTLSACGGETQIAAIDDSGLDQTVYEWKMITSWPKNLPALGTSPEYFADIVETMSQGRMRIRVYGANELVGGLEVFDAVSQGVAEIGHSGAYYWQGKIPATPFFSSIPFSRSKKRQTTRFIFPPFLKSFSKLQYELCLTTLSK